jgi:hypothetical protein
VNTVAAKIKTGRPPNTSTLRGRIIEVIGDHGPQTVAQLCNRLGEPKKRVENACASACSENLLYRTLDYREHRMQVFALQPQNIVIDPSQPRQWWQV